MLYHGLTSSLLMLMEIRCRGGHSNLQREDFVLHTRKPLVEQNAPLAIFRIVGLFENGRLLLSILGNPD